MHSANKLWSISALAAVAGRDRRTIKKLLADVAPDGDTKGHPGWRLDSAGPAIWGGGPTSDLDPEELMPGDRKLWYDGEKTRVDLTITKRQLVHAEDCRLQLSLVIKENAQFMENLPDILERDCGMTGTQVARVQIACDQQRENLANRLIEIDVDE